MEWWEKPLRALQFNVEDPYGYYADRITDEYLIELAKKTHSNVLVVFARDGWGRVFYQGSNIYPEHHKSAYDIRSLVEKGRKNGIKVVVMGNHTANRYVYKKHPEYAQRTMENEVVVLEHYPTREKVSDPHWPLICLNSPAFQKYFLPEAREITEKSMPDGYLLDSFRYLPDLSKACYCKYCRERFRREYGLDLPSQKSLDDPAYKHAWEWRYKVIVEKIKELREAVKSVNSETLFMYNSHPAGWAGRGNRVAEMAREYLDGLFAEATEADFKGPGLYTFLTKLSTAVIGEGKPVFVSRNLFYTLRTSHSATPQHVRHGVWEIVAAGGNPMATIFSSQAINDPRAIDSLAEAYAVLEKLEEYLEGLQPLDYIGLVYSNLTHDIYHHFHPHFYVGEVIGYSLLLMHNHLPWRILSDTDLEKGDLGRYKAIILANTGVLSDRATENLKRYYYDYKGNFIGSHEVGVIRPDYTYREYMSLEDVFGVRYEGVLKFGYTYVTLDLGANGYHKKYWKELPETIPLGDPSSSFRRERAEPMLGEIVRLVTTEAKALACLRMGKSAYGYEYTLGKSTPPPGSPLKLPGITFSSSGENFALYYSFRLGAHYDRLGHPDYNLIFINLLKEHLQPPPLHVIAPDTVQAEYYRRGVDEFVVQLVNHTYNQRMLDAPSSASRQHLTGFDPHYSVHPIRKVIPVHDIKIVTEMEGLRAYDPLKGEELRLEKSGNSTIYRIPKLEEYSLIVLQRHR